MTSVAAVFMLALAAQSLPDLSVWTVTDETGDVRSVEAGSIRGNARQRRARIQTIYAHPNKDNRSTSRAEWLFNCQDRAYTMRSLVFFDASEKVTERHHGKLPWLPVIPGTPGAAILAHVCAD